VSKLATSPRGHPRPPRSCQTADLAAVLAADLGHELACWVVRPPARQTVGLNLASRGRRYRSCQKSPLKRNRMPTRPSHRTSRFVACSLSLTCLC
ncbi:unnamed protein product, partial [Symbiodinium sp. CCMP2456]